MTNEVADLRRHRTVNRDRQKPRHIAGPWVTAHNIQTRIAMSTKNRTYRYRGFTIKRSGYRGDIKWEFIHDEYDGPGDCRTGSASTLPDAYVGIIHALSSYNSRGHEPPVGTSGESKLYCILYNWDKQDDDVVFIGGTSVEDAEDRFAERNGLVRGDESWYRPETGRILWVNKVTAIDTRVYASHVLGDPTVDTSVKAQAFLSYSYIEPEPGWTLVNPIHRLDVLEERDYSGREITLPYYTDIEFDALVRKGETIYDLERLRWEQLQEAYLEHELIREDDYLNEVSSRAEDTDGGQ